MQLTSRQIIRYFQIPILRGHGQIQRGDGQPLGLAERPSIVGRHGVLAGNRLEGGRRRCRGSRCWLEHSGNRHYVRWRSARTSAAGTRTGRNSKGVSTSDRPRVRQHRYDRSRRSFVIRKSIADGFTDPTRSSGKGKKHECRTVPGRCPLSIASGNLAVRKGAQEASG